MSINMYILREKLKLHFFLDLSFYYGFESSAIALGLMLNALHLHLSNELFLKHFFLK